MDVYVGAIQNIPVYSLWVRLKKTRSICTDPKHAHTGVIRGFHRSFPSGSLKQLLRPTPGRSLRPHDRSPEEQQLD